MAVDRRGLRRAPSSPSSSGGGGAWRESLVSRARRSTWASDSVRSQTTVIETRGSRLEIAAVALALLLPIPLFAASGLRLPLPEAIERGLASLAAGGGFEPAAAEAGPVRTETSSVSTGASPGGPAAATGIPATGSGQTQTVTGSAASSARDDEREKLPAAGGPTAESDGRTPLAGGGNPVSDSGGGSGGDAEDRILEATVVTPTAPESTQADVTADLDAAGASAEIDVVEGGIEVDAAAPGVDVEVDTPPAVPVSPPPLSLP
jgi:hypothetical protein